jgi:two-component system sensor histidine kinase RegB
MRATKPITAPFLVAGHFCPEKDQAAPRLHDSLKGAWLVRIRWVALLAFVVVVSTAIYLLDLRANVGVIAALVLLGVASNVALMRIIRRQEQSSLIAGGAAITIDVMLLAALLYLYGGYTNPFSMIFLVYVTLAASFLNSRWTWSIFGLSVALFVGLFFFHIPLEQLSMHAHHGTSSGFSLHLHGMLVAFIVIGLLVSYFLTRLSKELEQQSVQLAILSEQENERRRLIGLATLTAGAAHELATPIGTLTLIVDDLKRALKEIPEVSEDIAVMEEELRRCEAVLTRMRSQSSELAGEAPSAASVGALLAEVKRELRDEHRVSIDAEGVVDEALYTLKGSLVSSLHALVRNGVQASTKGGLVSLTARLVGGGIEFVVKDSGKGMDQETLRRVGDPFFTTKDPGEGLGLGVFLVKSFANHVGGSFAISSVLGNGTEVRLFVPREVAV